jgi:hypothetical protein
MQAWEFLELQFSSNYQWLTIFHALEHTLTSCPLTWYRLPSKVVRQTRLGCFFLLLFSLTNQQAYSAEHLIHLTYPSQPTRTPKFPPALSGD